MIHFVDLSGMCEYPNPAHLGDTVLAGCDVTCTLGRIAIYHLREQKSYWFPNDCQLHLSGS